MDSILTVLEDVEASRLVVWTDPASGLRAFLVIDDLSLGPAAGGIRTARYADVRAAVADAARLARTMSLKCSIAGLDSGGAKMVVMDHPGLDRAAAFDLLGCRIDELGGLFLTAGDLGTTAADLERVARWTSYVCTDEELLGSAVARGLTGCLRAALALRGVELRAGSSVAIQGCGTIGSAVATELAGLGVSLRVADLDDARASAVAATTGATVEPADRILLADVDAVAPCAAGEVIDVDVAAALRAPVVCGAANNILATDEAGAVLHARDILFVPDMIASAGAVIAGVCQARGGGAPETLIGALGATASSVLREASETGEPPSGVAMRRAAARIAEASA